MAKLLRVKIIEKTYLLRQKGMLGQNFLPSRPVMSNPPSLLDLKSTDIGFLHRFTSPPSLSLTSNFYSFQPNK